MKIKILVAVILGVAVLGIGGGVVWWLSVPHSVQEQMDYAGKLDKQLVGDAATKSAEEVKGELKKTVAAYEKVEGKWGKSAVAGAAWKRVAEIEEGIAKDVEAEKGAPEHLVKEYPEEGLGGAALLDLARVIRGEAEGLKGTDEAGALKKYQEALGRLEEYRKSYPAGKQGDAALMEIGRIWQDGIGDPLINAIKTFEKFLGEYEESPFRPEALYRLGVLMEKVKEVDRALALYTELLEKYPKERPWAEKALEARGKLLAEKMDKPKEAAEDFKKLQQDFPDSPLRGEAKGEEKSAREQDATKEGESYGKGRYGGRVPADTLTDKALPPAAMFKQFAEEKLDAEHYDLDVAFTPSEHLMRVKGTLKVANRGEEKKELLLMLARRGMEVKEVTVDGAVTKGEQSGDAWKIELPAVMKKDAEVVVGFEYEGRFAAPVPDMKDMMKQMAAGRKHHEEGAATRPEGEGASTQSASTQGDDTLKREQHTGAKREEEAGDESMMRARGESAATQAGAKRVVFNPQLGLGDDEMGGYGLAGGPWYPVTILGDMFTARMRFTIPDGLEVVANGENDKRVEGMGGDGGNLGEFIFETKRPVMGLYFCYGKYVVAEKTVNGIHFYTYLKAANADKSDAYIDVASKILGFYAERFGEFPFEKMALIECPLPPMLGGVGPASMMVLHQSMVAHPEVPSTLLAHELAHQWFGNLVPINITDPGYNQWLSEGFATYADALYTEHTDGAEAFVRHIEKYGQLYFQSALAYRRMVAIKDCLPGSALYRPVVYEKGAIVLHALRKVMGDEKFFGLMKKYVATYADKDSTVNDFRRLADEVMGEDLSWFFAEWLDQAIYADWVITGVDAKAGTPSGFEVVVHVRQPEDLVKMPADVTVVGAKGERQVVKDVMFDKFEQDVTVKTEFKPVKVILDEDDWVLKTLKADNVWTAGEEKAAATTAPAAVEMEGVGK